MLQLGNQDATFQKHNIKIGECNIYYSRIILFNALSFNIPLVLYNPISQPKIIILDDDTVIFLPKPINPRYLRSFSIVLPKIRQYLDLYSLHNPKLINWYNIRIINHY